MQRVNCLVISSSLSQPYGLIPPDTSGPAMIPTSNATTGCILLLLFVQLIDHLFTSYYHLDNSYIIEIDML